MGDTTIELHGFDELRAALDGLSQAYIVDAAQAVAAATQQSLRDALLSMQGPPKLPPVSLPREQPAGLPLRAILLTD